MHLVLVTVNPVVNEFKVSVPAVTVSVPTVVVVVVFANVAPFASFNLRFPYVSVVPVTYGTPDPPLNNIFLRLNE